MKVWAELSMTTDGDRYFDVVREFVRAFLTNFCVINPMNAGYGIRLVWMQSNRRFFEGEYQ